MTKDDKYRTDYAARINADGHAVCIHDPAHVIRHDAGPEWALRVLRGHERTCATKSQADRDAWTKSNNGNGRSRWPRC